MKHHFSYAVILLASFCLLGIYSCKKDNGPNPNGSNGTDTSGYTISYTGNQYVGDTIHFQAVGNANATFLWKFGDNATSTLMTPNHVYVTIPYQLTLSGDQYIPDTVKLIVNNDTLHPIIKILQIYPGVQRVSGMRTWHRTQYVGQENNINSYILSDTTFPINVVNDSAISVLGMTLWLDPSYAVSVYNNPDQYAYTIPQYYIFSYSSNNDTVSLYQNLLLGGLDGQDYIMYVSP